MLTASPGIMLSIPDHPEIANTPQLDFASPTLFLESSPLPFFYNQA
jgi:hypothetical protein